MKCAMSKMVVTACLLLSMAAYAGFDEGLAAYKKKDYATALKEWEPLASQGNAVAQTVIGVMYDLGQGAPQDYKEAVKWYRLAADQGNANAQNSLGMKYVNGQGVPQDYKEAVKWYRLAADQGNANAQTNLGAMYDNGHGVPQDYKEAVKWYRLAADQGNADAQLNLGGVYGDGHGVPQDYKEAVKWSRLAADQGNANAQFNLGWMYVNGHGVPQDYKEAVKWSRLAADQGKANAQNDLGAMYVNGQGIHQSRVMAFALYNVSATNDPSTDNKAIANREELSSSMTAAEVAAGQALSREISKPGMLLKALDKYSKKPAVKEKASTASSDLPVNSASSKGPYPSRPAKQPGLTSCNTRCNNADCYRTYDDGRKVHFQAKQKFNPLNSQFEWDSGSC